MVVVEVWTILLVRCEVSREEKEKRTYVWSGHVLVDSIPSHGHSAHSKGCLRRRVELKDSLLDGVQQRCSRHRCEASKVVSRQ